MFEEFVYDNETSVNITAEQLLARGVPQSAIDVRLAQDRIGLIKKECGRRILAVGSNNARENMSAYAIRLGRKDTLTNADKAMLAAYDAGIDWIAAMQANVVALGEELEADYLSDDAWPKVPDGLAEIAAQF